MGAASPKSTLIAPTPIFSSAASFAWYHVIVRGFEKSRIASSEGSPPLPSRTASPWLTISGNSALLGTKYGNCQSEMWNPSFFRSWIIFAGSGKRVFENW